MYLAKYFLQDYKNKKIKNITQSIFYNISK